MYIYSQGVQFVEPQITHRLGIWTKVKKLALNLNPKIIHSVEENVVA